MTTSSGAVMNSRQAAELDHALERNGWTPADVKKLSMGDQLAKLLPVVRGRAEVVQTKHLIDLSGDPFVPDGWKVEEHHKGDHFEWNPEKVVLYLDEAQKNGGIIEGNKLRKKLKGKSVFNAILLDYLLGHPELIPEEWKGKAIFFWGTICRSGHGRLYVSCLSWDGDRWTRRWDWLVYDWSDRSPGLISKE